MSFHSNLREQVRIRVRTLLPLAAAILILPILCSTVSYAQKRPTSSSVGYVYDLMTGKIVEPNSEEKALIARRHLQSTHPAVPTQLQNFSWFIIRTPSDNSKLSSPVPVATKVIATPVTLDENSSYSESTKMDSPRTEVPSEY